jgi:cytochrome b pre-mRNA-processing protein 3
MRETQLLQALIDAVFVGFDEGLRDMGAGDMGMGRRLKAMANAFYGRLSAYDAAASEAEMTEALKRNVFRGAAGVDSEARTLANYVFSARNSLEQSDLPLGQADFGALPK